MKYLMKELELRPGTNNIILVAPHGFPGDDDNTGTITRDLRNRLQCYAAINEKYRRPKEGEETDREHLLADCNDIPSLKAAALEVEWLDKIKGFREEIIAKAQKNDADGKCYIFHIHGIEDGNAKKYQ